MIDIYIAGSADVRKKNQPPPPGGYGALAVRGGQQIFEMGGTISTRTPNVTTITENLALLVATLAACGICYGVSNTILWVYWSM